MSQAATLGDRGGAAAEAFRVLNIQWSQRRIPAPGAVSWQNPTASSLVLAENVRLNNCLPTAVSDALQITELFDIIDLLQDGILLCVLRIAVICFHCIWKPAVLQ